MSSTDVPQVIHDFFETSQIPLSLSAPTLREDPLILANEAFYRMTGFNSDEALGKNCRFYPSCSCYAEEAIKVHGISKGVYLGFQRLLKCHPFHAGGYDPVPQSEKEKS
jgi:putative membrane protein insertion efficiency factor